MVISGPGAAAHTQIDPFAATTPTVIAVDVDAMIASVTIGRTAASQNHGDLHTQSYLSTQATSAV